MNNMSIDFLYVCTINDALKQTNSELPQIQKYFAPVFVKASDVIESRPISRKELYVEYFGLTKEEWDDMVDMSKVFGNEVKDDEVILVKFKLNGEEGIGWLFGADAVSYIEI